MLLLGAIAAVAVVGGVAYAIRPAKPKTPEGAKPIGNGIQGAEPAAEGKPLPKAGGGSEELKYLTTGVGVLGSVVGVVKGIAGTAGATAGTAGASSGGVSLATVGGFAVAVAAVVGFVTFSIMLAATEFENLKNGAFGYVQNQLVKLGNETAERYRAQLVKPASEGGAGLSEVKASALARLVGFAVAVGYNRAAWAYVKRGAQREVQFGINVTAVGASPEFRHEAYYVARAYGLPDDPGYIYEPAGPPPPKPPGFTGAWPPPPPLLDGRQWAHTLEWFMFQGVNTTRALSIAEAGELWNAELESACDFIGRASRCSYALHNKLGPGGQALAVVSTEGAVRQYAEMGCIGLPTIPAPTGVFPSVHPHPPGAANAVVDSARQCIRQNVAGKIAWFFSETIEHGAVPVRAYP